MPAYIVAVIGRAMLALLFILAGLVKIATPKPFAVHMAEHHVPRQLLPLVICLELGAGACVLLGWHLAIAAGALGTFCIAAAFVFHLDLTDKAERTLFIKDVAIAGALLYMAATNVGVA